ncbi:MAG: chorismate mutase [Peptostreptococcaceae bacterium]|jgi:chorismate mutase/prephenate dehydratase|nr:chorismate mutase [Peptostreptococcaceae bacterium]
MEDKVENKIDSLRTNIDDIDKDIINLLEERIKLCKDISDIKKSKNLKVYDKKREENILNNIRKKTTTDNENLIINIYKNILKHSKEVQKKNILRQDYNKDEDIKEGYCNKGKKEKLNKDVAIKKEMDIKDLAVEKKEARVLKVGHQGLKGAFSNEALEEYFKGKVKTIKRYNEFEDLVKGLTNKEVDYVVIPIENSSTGSITKVYDLLKKYDVYINAEISIKINQHLIGTKDSSLKDIKEVYTHIQGFKQCNNFFLQKSVKKYCVENTARGAYIVKDKNQKHIAAVGSKQACLEYDLKILKENIEDSDLNYTRFFILSRNLNTSKESNKISLLTNIKHEKGMLYTHLKSLYENNINMLKIESRPIKDTLKEYNFYIDIEGNLKDGNIKRALENMKRNSNDIRILGNYKMDKNY